MFAATTLTNVSWATTCLPTKSDQMILWRFREIEDAKYLINKFIKFDDKINLDEILSDKFFNQDNNLEFWKNCQKMIMPVFDEKGKLTGVNVFM